MRHAALRFAPLVEGWAGPVDWQSLRSQPFAYVSLPDSQLSPEQLRAHYERVDEAYRQTYRGCGLHYLGSTPQTLLPASAPESVSLPADGWAAQGTLVARTVEVAVNRPAFRERLRAALAAQGRIRVRLGHRVEEIERAAEGFRVSAVTADGQPWRGQFATVVNCSWTDRLRLDRQLGSAPDRGWVYGLKYRLLGRLPGASGRPSLTFALGTFGDLVTYPGDHVYVSWYPVCLRGWSQDRAPPACWDRPCSGRTLPADSAAVTAGVQREFGRIVPALRHLCVEDVAPGVICSWGTRDIDDPASELHRRSTTRSPRASSPAHPLFADRLAARLRAEGGLRGA
ncbi:MAG: hypothetical protein AB1505_30285 [Candidatus Latescibacterota bacterium]